MISTFTAALALPVSDPEGGNISVSASISYQGQSATISPTSTTVDGSGTLSFSITLINTNGTVTITATDDRGGSDTFTATIGPDNRSTC